MSLPKELKLVLWNLPASNVPKGDANISELKIDFTTNPALFELVSDQWSVVSHTVLPVASGGLLLTLFLERPISPSGITD